ncbi:hypothetical protein ACM6P1_14530, partial [Enterococcus faecium]|uniref:hypothetical protein n=1 Tax=Enterococcus faecium TaxID=1352 RepID=UPI0039FDA723
QRAEAADHFSLHCLSPFQPLRPTKFITRRHLQLLLFSAYDSIIEMEIGKIPVKNGNRTPREVEFHDTRGSAGGIEALPLSTLR